MYLILKKKRKIINNYAMLLELAENTNGYESHSMRSFTQDNANNRARCVYCMHIYSETAMQFNVFCSKP